VYILSHFLVVIRFMVTNNQETRNLPQARTMSQPNYANFFTLWRKVLHYLVFAASACIQTSGDGGSCLLASA
jgi:hypothetical protein